MVSYESLQRAVQRYLSTHPDRKALRRLLRVLSRRLPRLAVEIARDTVDWDPLVKRLVLYAGYRLRLYPWRGSYHNLPGGAMEAEDVVQEAVERFLARERKWAPARCALFPFFIEVIRSLVSHEHERNENQAFHDFDNVLVQAIDKATVEQLDRYTADETLIAREIADRFLGKLSNRTLRKYVALRIFGRHDGAADYAAVLGVPVSAIYNMDRLLKRRRGWWNPAR